MVEFWSIILRMGQSASAPKAIRRKSTKSLNSHRSSKSKSNLSHTFTINDNDDRIELLNINHASEEELMTLPGINREIAKCIVEHRRVIGRFRKIEDLALVRGIGADKLEIIRPEICVTNKRNNLVHNNHHHHVNNSNSCQSSRAQSYDSLKSSDSRTTIKSSKLINLNKASVFDLQCIHGITQEIAANIVHYREKKGPFKQVEDLLKVKNIDRIRYYNISRFLTVENNDQDDNIGLETNRLNNILTNGFHTNRPSTIVLEQQQQNGCLPQMQLTNGITTTSALLDIFELLSTYSPRPILQEIFNFQRNNEPAFRIGSWNLCHLTFEKANNPGVREVICRTILENGLSIIAIQEVFNVSALRLICDELNRPRLRRVSEWKDRNHSWNFCMLDNDDLQLGFIYDTNGVVDIELVSLTQGPDDTKNDCQVIVANFQISHMNLRVINMKLTKFAKFDLIDEKLKDLTTEEDMLLVLVDFSEIALNSSVTIEDWLNIGGLRSVFPSTTTTLHPAIKNPNLKHISNILYNNKIQGQITGINGIIKQGLTHLAIPNGWNWGGSVSPYCPIWIELFQNMNVGTAL